MIIHATIWVYQQCMSIRKCHICKLGRKRKGKWWMNSVLLLLANFKGLMSKQVFAIWSNFFEKNLIKSVNRQLCNTPIIVAKCYDPILSIMFDCIGNTNYNVLYIGVNGKRKDKYWMNSRLLQLTSLTELLSKQVFAKW